MHGQRVFFRICLCEPNPYSDSISSQLYPREFLYRQLNLTRDSGEIVPIEGNPIGLSTRDFVLLGVGAVDTPVHFTRFHFDERLMVFRVRRDLSNDRSVLPGRKLRG